MGRTIIVGDIHGCNEELLDLMDRVGLGDDDVLVSVGDLVDRGPGSVEVVRFFRERPGAVALCGNHERKHVRGTLSYGQEIVRVQFGDGYPDAVAWMGTLPYFREADGVRVVHAAMIPGVPLAETPDEILAGTTSGEEKLRARLGGRWWHELYTDDVPVVFGHHVVGEEPLVVRDRVFGIDTGAAHGMRLTALVLPSFALVQVPARADHWKRVQREFQVPVLRSRPWRTTTWERIVRDAGRVHAPDPEGRAFVDGVLAWADALRGSIPRLADALDAELARLSAEVGDEGLGRAAAAHPAAGTLMRYHAGRLQGDHLGSAPTPSGPTSAGGSSPTAIGSGSSTPKASSGSCRRFGAPVVGAHARGARLGRLGAGRDQPVRLSVLRETARPRGGGVRHRAARGVARGLGGSAVDRAPSGRARGGHVDPGREEGDQVSVEVQRLTGMSSTPPGERSRPPPRGGRPCPAEV